MATATISEPTVVQQQAPLLYRFTVKQYHRMIQAGILTEDHRVELLEGVIVDKMPHTPRHDGTVTRIQRRLTRLLPEDWILRIQCAITTRKSEPEPDLALVAGPEDIYFTRHPKSEDIGLLIEVADTTLEFDRTEKSQLYARTRVPVYWIVNLNERQLEVYSEPKGGKSPAYRRRTNYAETDSVSLALGRVSLGLIPIRELLP